MKASELIKELQEMQEKHGDLEVAAYGMDRWGYAEDSRVQTVLIKKKTLGSYSFDLESVNPNNWHFMISCED